MQTLDAVLNNKGLKYNGTINATYSFFINLVWMALFFDNSYNEHRFDDNRKRAIVDELRIDEEMNRRMTYGIR